MADQTPPIQRVIDPNYAAALYWSLYGDQSGGYNRMRQGGMPEELRRVLFMATPELQQVTPPDFAQRYMNQAMFGQEQISPLMRLLMQARTAAANAFIPR